MGIVKRVVGQAGTRRWRVLGVVATLLALLLWLWVDAGHPVWRVPGRTAGELNAGTTRFSVERAETLIVRDSFFAFLLGASLIAFALAGASWTSARGRRLQLGAIGAATGAMLADWMENVRLWKLLDQVMSRSVTDGEARALAILSNTKWGMLAAAVLLTVAAMQRRTPIDQPRRVWQSSPDRAPDADWDATPGRLGIAVTGGGIRAASFTLGVMQVLHRKQVLEKAAYVTSVSGGGYTVGAYTALNQMPHRASDAFAPGTPEEQGLRRSLRYITRDPAVLAGALGRVVLGVLLNLWLLYIVLFALVRPIGWLAGSTWVHPELRVSEPVAVAIAGFDDDPDTGADEQPYLTQCGLTTDPDATTVQLIPGSEAVISEEPRRVAYAYEVTVPTQCVQVVVPPERETIAVRVPVTQVLPGIVVLENGRLTVDRQPVVKLGTAVPCPIDVDVVPIVVDDGAGAPGDATGGDAPPAVCPTLDAPVPDPAAVERAYAIEALHDVVGDDLVGLTQPTIEVGESATGIAALTTDSTFVSVDRSAGVAPDSVLERRGELDLDRRHWLPAVGFLGAAMVLLLWRVIGRPDYWRALNKWASYTGAIGAAWGIIMVALPWMIDWAPRLLTSAASTGPSDDLWNKSLDWLPIPRSAVPHLVAWPLLSLASVWNFVKKRKPNEKGPAVKSRGAKALARKFATIATGFAIWALLVVTALSSIVLIVSVGALNGPWGRFTFISTEVLSTAKYGWFPVDVALWFGIALALVVSRGAGEASSWSPAPIYKRRLAWAFAWQRPRAGHADNRAYGPTETWQNLVGESRNGRVVGDGTPEHPGPEHVLCCAANVLGERTAPTGRRSVSFTISRSWIGGPEVGWVATDEYLGRMGRRRRWDFTLPGAVSISGAAAAPAMGKKEIGPRGSVLAILNVRLGAWLPHPGWVAKMDAGTTWNHNPGWPWFVREVLRDYRPDAPYLYVSDGGHWENLGIVEALRRGCTELIVISASGDGELSHHAIAEAVEIARTDLGVEIELDGIWEVRPKIGGDPDATLGSGRQYIVEPGPAAALGRAAQQAFTMGTITFTRSGEPPVTGHILVLDAAMIDGLPVDVHEYAESHAEFPHVSTGDQLFTDRDFEAYRTLGREIATRALSTPVTAPLFAAIDTTP